MEVYLLPLGEGTACFYSEGPEPRDDEEGPGPGRGLRGWLERTYRRVRDTLENSEGGLGRNARRLWAWLKRFTSPDEPMLRRLRRADRVRLHHPTTMDPKEAQSAWEGYLSARRRHHLIWLVVDLVISPLSVILAPIPGPNVVGYWFVYRAACHAMALFGIKRARNRGGKMIFHPSAVLDTPPDMAGDDRMATFAARLGLGELGDFLDRVGAGRSRPGRSQDARR